MLAKMMLDLLVITDMNWESEPARSWCAAGKRGGRKGKTGGNAGKVGLQ